MNVLIIDDEIIVIKILTMALKKIDYIDEINSANNVSDGLALIHNELPAIVFLDLTLKERHDGFEILKKIKKAYPSVSVAVVSADVHISTVRKILSLGAQAYIKKPFSEKQIEKIVWKLGQINNKRGK